VRVLVALQQSARVRRAVSLAPFQLKRRPCPGQVIVRPPVEHQQAIDAPSPSAD
jgi:hypothetical protein